MSTANRREPEPRPLFELDPGRIHAGVMQAHAIRRQVLATLFREAADGLAGGVQRLMQVWRRHGHHNGPGAYAR
jgi:hypothetical protein